MSVNVIYSIISPGFHLNVVFLLFQNSCCFRSRSVMDVKNRWTVWILVSSFMCTSNNICSAQLCSELCRESPTSRFDIDSGSRISSNDLADSGPDRSNSSGIFVKPRRSNKGFGNFFADYLEEKRAIKPGHRKSDQKVNTFVRIGKFLRSRERIPSTFVRIGRDKTTRLKDRIPNTFVRIVNNCLNQKTGYRVLLWE